MYVYFDMDERTVLDVRRLVNEGKITPLRELGSIPISLELPGETGFPHKGKVTFINNQVDPLTGTLTARGVFENPRPTHGTRLMTPGNFVRVHVPIGQAHTAILVAERALGTDQGLKFLYVVNSQNKVEYRRVTTGPLEHDGLRVITQGLKPGEWVVISGLQLVRPNAQVVPEQAPMAATAVDEAAAATGEPATEPVDTPASNAPSDAKASPARPAAGGGENNK